MGILGTMTATDDTQEHPVVAAEVAPSLEVLYAAHAAALTRVLRAAGFPDPADAVQEAFVQAVVHWRKVSRYDDPVAWIRRVAINRGRNRRRSHRRRAALTERIAATSTSSVLYGLDPADHDGDLADLIVTLPPQQRLALSLYYFADLPVAAVDEIAWFAATDVTQLPLADASYAADSDPTIDAISSGDIAYATRPRSTRATSHRRDRKYATIGSHRSARRRATSVTKRNSSATVGTLNRPQGT